MFVAKIATPYFFNAVGVACIDSKRMRRMMRIFMDARLSGHEDFGTFLPLLGISHGDLSGSL